MKSGKSPKESAEILISAFLGVWNPKKRTGENDKMSEKRVFHMQRFKLGENLHILFHATFLADRKLCSEMSFFLFSITFLHPSSRPGIISIPYNCRLTPYVGLEPKISTSGEHSRSASLACDHWISGMYVQKEVREENIVQHFGTQHDAWKLRKLKYRSWGSVFVQQHAVNKKVLAAWHEVNSH